MDPITIGAAVVAVGALFKWLGGAFEAEPENPEIGRLDERARQLGSSGNPSSSDELVNIMNHSLVGKGSDALRETAFDGLCNIALRYPQDRKTQLAIINSEYHSNYPLNQLLSKVDTCFLEAYCNAKGYNIFPQEIIGNLKSKITDTDILLLSNYATDSTATINQGNNKELPVRHAALAAISDVLSKSNLSDNSYDNIYHCILKNSHVGLSLLVSRGLANNIVSYRNDNDAVDLLLNYSAIDNKSFKRIFIGACTRYFSISYNPFGIKFGKRLYCMKCYLFSTKSVTKVGVLNKAAYFNCRCCGKPYNLTANVIENSGMIGGSGISDISGGKATSQLFSNNRAYNADITKLIIDGSSPLDFDRAINEVVNTLKNDSCRPAKWLKKVPVVLKNNPSISENTRNMIKKEFKAVTLEA